MDAVVLVTGIDSALIAYRNVNDFQFVFVRLGPDIRKAHHRLAIGFKHSYSRAIFLADHDVAHTIEGHVQR